MSGEPRVGVFVCDCGTNIAATVNCPKVTEYAGGLEDVVFAEEGKWICSVDYLKRIANAVKEQDLNRVVVACCTPRTHEKLFKKTVAEGGMNPYQLEFVSIREQVSWVHKQDKEVATSKAEDLVKMGVAKARLLEEGEEIQLPVKTDCLVIGGGVAGLTAALEVAKQGFRVRIVEREPALGGLLNKLSSLAPSGASAAELAAELVAQAGARDNIEVFTGARIEAIQGYIGNYVIKLAADRGGGSKEFDTSTIIVATGMRELDPTGLYGYGGPAPVMTQLELESLLRQDQSPAGDVAIIQCVGSRNEQRGCCHIGCTVALKNALELKRRDPGRNVYLLYRDLITVKDEYAHMKEVMRQGVQLIRFPDDAPPDVSPQDGRWSVKVRDVLLGSEIELAADNIVLTVGFRGHESVPELRGQLKVSSNDDGFFQESHIKLGPLDFAANGVYLAGSARNPKPLRDAREEGIGAAMRASIPMARGFVEAEGIVAKVDVTGCSSCKKCWENCPFGAIEEVERKPHVLEALCKGCGLCAADCPKDCFQIVHFSDDQIMAAIGAATEEEAEKKIVAFVCHWCAHGAVDIAGVNRSEYPPNVRIIRVMCSARVDEDWVIAAFERGAGGVLVAGCEFPTCHYITGNYKCAARLEKLRKKLERKGYDTGRLWEVWLSAAMGPKWVATQKEMVAALGLEEVKP